MIFLLLFTTFLGGCFGGEFEEDLPVFELDHPEDARLIAAQSRLSCPSTGPCPNSVALLAHSDENKQYLKMNCTAFLVDGSTLKGISNPPSLVMATNAHCIPPDLRESGSSCHNRIWFTFPETGEPIETHFDCDRVIAVSKHYTTSSLQDNPETTNLKAVGVQDVAFLSLKKAPNQRNSYEISNRGGSHLQNIVTTKVNFKSDTHRLKAELKTVSCKINKTQFLLKDHLAQEELAHFDSDWIQFRDSPIIQVSNCNPEGIFSGNSGAPIIDPRYPTKVMGIIQSAPPIHINRVINTGYASAFSCLLESFAFNQSIPSVCGSLR